MFNSAPIGANTNATGSDSATFEITDAKLYIPVVTLPAEDDARLLKLWSDGFKRMFIGM